MEPDPARAGAERASGRHYTCTITNVALRLLREDGGEQTVAAVLERAGSLRSVPYLEDIENWISVDELCALLEAAVERTGNPHFARRVGEETLRQHSGTQVATVLRSLGSPEAVLNAVALATPKFSTTTELEATETRSGHAVIRAVAREGFPRTVLQCDYTAGMLAAATVLFGLPLAEVKESECQARGDGACVYTVSWDPELAERAVDPQQRVTALESQLASMSERLENAYATAGDLISTEDLPTVLQRIVERAASAVRAPGYILAVRTESDQQLQVYAHGIEPAEARRFAQAALAGDGTPGSDSTLVVEVSSARREYGQLIARYPGAVEFFPQEREMLSLYAKHAAAVLDMATALEEADRQNDQVSSLLALALALAQAGTSEEVAERLAIAIPDVIDCDGLSVWLWDEEQGSLGALAAWAREPEQAEFLRGLSVGRDDTDQLERLINASHPLFFEPGAGDRFIARLIERLDLAALVAVPIVARNVFHGALCVSITERAERLRPDPELMARLTGVAALAAPAIQNGRLVDQLRHEANHDGLTGLLNRIGFRQQIGAVMNRADTGEEHVGLLFVDLNDFKNVNDVHGHEAGDELIRQAAERLSSISRESDAVARLGGDEFALILAGVNREEQLRAAEERVRRAFVQPFDLGEATVSLGASVGGGLWPDDGRTVAELIRHADGAMYRDKAEAHRSSVRSAREPAPPAR